AGSPGTAGGLIVVHRATADGETRAQEIGDAAAQPVPADLRRAAERLVVVDRAVADGRFGPIEVREPTTNADAGQNAVGIAGPTDGLVVAEGEVGSGQALATKGTHAADRAARAHAHQKEAAANCVVVASKGLVMV